MDITTIGLGVVSCAAVPYFYGHIRQLLPCSVNCWFCNTDQKVAYTKRDAFVCKVCDQYNGFTDDGSYNKRIPGMESPLERTGSVKYCASGNSAIGRPDVVPCSSETNLMCCECNKKQQTIVELLGNFEPVNEERFDTELEDYKRRLEQVYGLCSRCQSVTMQKLNKDKQLYEHLLRIGRAARSLISSAGTRTSPTSPRRRLIAYRREWFAGGRKTELCHASTFLMALFMFVANVNFIQKDSEGSSALDQWLPSLLAACLSLMQPLTPYLSVFLLFTHMYSIQNNKCRVSFPDLIVLPMCACLALSSLVSNERNKEDVALFQCAFASLLTALLSAVWLLPRKLKHRKRPNTIASAFSIASTPESQCSSQSGSRYQPPTYLLRSNQSVATASNDRASHTASWIGSCTSNSLFASDVLHTPLLTAWRERHSRDNTPAPCTSPRTYNETMEWQAIESPEPEPPQQPQMQSLRNSFRENTPSRDLGGMLNTLQLGGQKDARRRGPFGSLTFNPSVRKTYSEIGRSFPVGESPSAGPKSVFANSGLSHFTSVSQRSPNTTMRARSMITQERAESTITSVSAREEQSSNVQRWLLISVVVSLLFNMALGIYVVFLK